MPESTTLNPISDLVAESVKSLQALLATLQQDSKLQEGIRNTIEKLTAKPEQTETPPKTETAAETATNITADTEPSETPADTCCDSEADSDAICCSSRPDFSDGDVVATLALGFAAGAAVVGGGILLHKLLSD